MKSHFDLCEQTGCEAPATYRYTWPGRNETKVCVLHATKARNVADAIGMHLQLIPIAVDPETKTPPSGDR